jgi:hypothetical protein
MKWPQPTNMSIAHSTQRLIGLLTLTVLNASDRQRNIDGPTAFSCVRIDLRIKDHHSQLYSTRAYTSVCESPASDNDLRISLGGNYLTITTVLLEEDTIK